jgi:hypothetical protein
MDPKRFGATNKPWSCLWCGRDLKVPQFAHVYKTGTVGFEADDHFCTQRCGYEFGLAMAGLGKRLQPKQEASTT